MVIEFPILPSSRPNQSIYLPDDLLESLIALLESFLIGCCLAGEKSLRQNMSAVSDEINKAETIAIGHSPIFVRSPISIGRVPFRSFRSSSIYASGAIDDVERYVRLSRTFKVNRCRRQIAVTRELTKRV